eukprot:Gregarina_sp_Pseudo_9__604@NODE_1387_length_1642_cov_485_180911_g1293_i0_p1_GENE_NODE_1387_length_1642_cov_485_180911_g1293_i0NODE_1387_length_1642_cov_485_180911_g1293_i0_p1_ORF_typecomplete_len261_score51_83Alpha_GJ/PF03229_13/2_5e03Alpha_GJ/PF03229_13/0_037_NODE_1387_length_1642_cov_485_180911_g1293_i07861568
MKCLTAVSGFFFCGALAADTPTLSVKVETAEPAEGGPTGCPTAAGDLTWEALQACYDSAQAFAGTFAYSGYVSAGEWTGVSCEVEAGAPAVAYFAVESLVKYVPEWVKAGGATGTYKVTLEKKTLQACEVSFLVPLKPDEDCAAAIAGTPAGIPLPLPADSQSLDVPAAVFADSLKLAMSANCALANAGASITAVDATNVKYAFSFNSEATPNPDEDSTENPDQDSTSNPEEEPTAAGPDGASARLIIGTLFALPLIAAL